MGLARKRISYKCLYRVRNSLSFCTRSFDSLCSLRMTGGVLSVISTEQREWRNLARQRCGYERFYFTLGFPLRGKLAAKPTEEGRRLSRSPFPLFRHFVTPSPQGEGKDGGVGAPRRRATQPFSPLPSLRDTFPPRGRQGWGSRRFTPPRCAALFPSSVTS